MSIVALIVVITSISNPESKPDIKITSFYESLQVCHEKLDELKKNINAIEIENTENNRMLKMYNREYHKQGIIYWTCKEKQKK